LATVPKVPPHKLKKKARRMNLVAHVNMDTTFWSGNPKERGYIGDFAVNGIVLLRLILEK
jgi:hypothetical protein